MALIFSGSPVLKGSGPHDLLAEGYPEEVGRCGQCYNPLAQEVMFIDPRSEEHLVINTLFSLMQHSLKFL